MTIKKIARIVLVTLTTLLAIVFLSLFILHNYVDGHAREVITDKVIESSDGKYQIFFGKYEIGLIAGNFQFDDVSLIAVGAPADSGKRICMAAGSIRIEGVALWNLYKNKKLSARRLSVNDLVVFVNQGKIRKKISEVSMTSPEIKELKSIFFENVDVDNTTLILAKSGQGLFCSQKGKLIAKGFKLDSLSSKEFGIHVDSFNLGFAAFSYRLGSDLYSLKGKGILASSTDSVLRVLEPELVPAYSKYDFGEAAGYQISRIKLNSHEMDLSELNVRAFIEDNWLIAKRLQVTELNVSVFRDTRIPLLKKVRPSFQKILATLPFGLFVDTVEVTDGNISYEEVKEGQKNTGKIKVSQVTGLIVGLSNDFSNSHSEILLSSQGKLQGQGKFYLHCLFPLNDSTEHFHCSGFLTGLDAASLNTFTEPNLNLKLNKGRIDSLEFSFLANNKESHGSIRSRYHDLHLEVMNRDGKKKQLLSGVANIIVHNDNPDQSGKLIEGKIHFERNPYRFFTYYIFKSILSGIPSSVGVPVVMSHD